MIVRSLLAFVCCWTFAACSASEKPHSFIPAQTLTVRSNEVYVLPAVPPTTGGTISFGNVTTAAGTSLLIGAMSSISTPKFPLPTQLVVYTFQFTADVVSVQSSPALTVALPGAGDPTRYTVTLSDSTTGNGIVSTNASAITNSSLVFIVGSAPYTFKAGHVYQLAIAMLTM